MLKDSERVQQQRQKVVEIGRLLERKSLVESTAGNISCRIDEDRVLITPAGRRKGSISPESVVEINLADGTYSGTPSSETPLHLGLYRHFPQVGAVIHAHPPYATAFAVAGIELEYDVLPEVVAQLGPVRLATYGRPTTDALFESVREHVESSNAILLSNHGSVTFGKTLDDAFNYLEQLEFFATVLYRARTLGKVNMLPAAEFEWLASVRKSALN